MPSETVKLEITITREAVEAVIEALASLFPLNRESKEESTKEESKEINSPITLANSSDSYESSESSHRDSNNNCVVIAERDSRDIGIDNRETDKGDNLYNGDKNTNTSVIYSHPNNTASNTNNNKAIAEEDNIPTLEAISNYIKEKGYIVDANKFYYYYKNNYWLTKKGDSIVGKWREYVDSWEKREYMYSNTDKSKKRPMTKEEWERTHPFVPTDFGDMT